MDEAGHQTLRRINQGRQRGSADPGGQNGGGHTPRKCENTFHDCSSEEEAGKGQGQGMHQRSRNYGRPRAAGKFGRLH